MRACRYFNNAHFTVRVREEIFLGLNGLSFTVPMSTQKTSYDLEFILHFCTHHALLFREDIRHTFMPVEVPLTE